MRISALMELKRYDEVLASADAYIARGKPSAEIFEIRGLAREARRHYAAAIADFNRALELTPDAAPAQRTRLLNLRGWAYHFADAPRLALADFEESLRLDAEPERRPGRPRAGSHPAGPVASRGDRRRGRSPARQPPWSRAPSEDRQARAQALFNAARIYAQAVEFAAQDVSRQGERGARPLPPISHPRPGPAR